MEQNDKCSEKATQFLAPTDPDLPTSLKVWELCDEHAEIAKEALRYKFHSAVTPDRNRLCKWDLFK